MHKQLSSNTHNKSDRKVSLRLCVMEKCFFRISETVVTTRKAQGLSYAKLPFVSKAALCNTPIRVIPVQSHLRPAFTFLRCHSMSVLQLAEFSWLLQPNYVLTVQMLVHKGIVGSCLWAIFGIIQNILPIWRSEFKLMYCLALFGMEMEMQLGASLNWVVCLICICLYWADSFHIWTFVTETVVMKKFQNSQVWAQLTMVLHQGDFRTLLQQQCFRRKSNPDDEGKEYHRRRLAPCVKHSFEFWF